jgi:hypothetical protein
MTDQADSLSLPEVARRLGVSHQTIWRAYKRDGEVLPGVRVFTVGSRLRVSRIQLDEFLHVDGTIEMQVDAATAALAAANEAHQRDLEVRIAAKERELADLRHELGRLLATEQAS